MTFVQLAPPFRFWFRFLNDLTTNFEINSIFEDSHQNRKIFLNKIVPMEVNSAPEPAQFSQNPTSGEVEVELTTQVSVPKIITHQASNRSSPPPHQDNRSSPPPTHQDNRSSPPPTHHDNRSSPPPDESPLSPAVGSAKTDAPAKPLTLKEQRWLKAKATVEYFAESSFFIGLMSVYTMWALYNDDIKLAGTSKESDLGFEVVISIGFFLFLFEIAAQCFYKPDYFYMPLQSRKEDETDMEMWIRRVQIGSFYFWLDWIATLSLILEVFCSLTSEILS